MSSKKKNLKKPLEQQRLVPRKTRFFLGSIHRKLFEELTAIEAFQGAHQGQTHFSQNPFVLGYRNQHSFSNLDQGFLGLQRAIQFLGRTLQKPGTQGWKNLVFVGNPPGAGQDYSGFFQELGIPFFEQGEWFPGYLSRDPKAYQKVLVIYDPSSNQDAQNEALRMKVPILGFLPSTSDIRGIDYPIPLNLDLQPGWILKLWQAFFLRVEREQGRQQRIRTRVPRLGPGKAWKYPRQRTKGPRLTKEQGKTSRYKKR